MNIEFTKKAYKEYKRLPAGYKDLLDSLLGKFSEGIPVDIVPVKGERNIYRIRMGKYRILFTKIDGDILIVRIDSRGDVYK